MPRLCLIANAIPIGAAIATGTAKNGAAAAIAIPIHCIVETNALTDPLNALAMRPENDSAFGSVYSPTSSTYTVTVEYAIRESYLFFVVV